MPNLARSKTQIDLTRFAFRLAHSFDQLGLSYSNVTEITGVTRRQISDATHSRPISAGATWMLCELCDIPIEESLPPDTQRMIARIRKVKQNHAVTLDVSCETTSSIALDEGLKSGKVVMLEEGRDAGNRNR